MNQKDQKSSIDTQDREASCSGGLAVNACSLPEEGYLRLKQIIGDPKADPPIPAIIPVSRSTFINGTKTGRFPKPVKKFGSRITVWRVSDIRALL
jgi:prophage regulatory protein